MPHDHTWDDVSRVYSPGLFSYGKVELSGASAELLREAMHGVTILTQRCSCGEYRQRRLLGRLPSPRPAEDAPSLSLWSRLFG